MQEIRKVLKGFMRHTDVADVVTPELNLMHKCHWAWQYLCMQLKINAITSEKKRQERQDRVACRQSAVLSVVCLWTHLLMCDFLQVTLVCCNLFFLYHFVSFRMKHGSAAHKTNWDWWVCLLLLRQYGGKKKKKGFVRQIKLWIISGHDHLELLLVLPLHLPTTPSTPCLNPC